MSAKTVLLLSATPLGHPQLRIQAEEREIKEQLRSDRVIIRTSTAARPRDIQRALLEVKPEIVHFSGHGGGTLNLEIDRDPTQLAAFASAASRQGTGGNGIRDIKTDVPNSSGHGGGIYGLVLEDDDGNPRLVSSEALANLFQMFTCRYPIECVVLNACYSEVQAREIAKCVDYVIGMTGSISDKAAIEFSVGFYRGLSSGETYEFSYQLGCNAIQLVGLPQPALPMLLSGIRENRQEANQCFPERTENRQDSTGLAKLEGLLRAGWWKEADSETTGVFLRTVGRAEGDWVRDHEIETFPCTVLRNVDALWSKFSNGRFGISVQRETWKRLGGLGTHPKGDGDLERKFGDTVGWRRNEEWLDYHSYTFNLSAPPGHLPRDYCRHGSGWWLGRSCLLSTRLVICDAAFHTGNLEQEISESLPK
ncbi:MAG: GUN4 domain-containing protein [Thermoanaerobaculia bacterium]